MALSCLLSVAMTKHWPKSSQWWGVYFILDFQVTANHWRKSGQKIKTGTWNGSFKATVLTSLVPDPCSAICVGMAPPTVDWVLPCQLAIKEMPYRHACSQANLMVATPQSSFLLPKYVKDDQDKYSHQIRMKWWQALGQSLDHTDYEAGRVGHEAGKFVIVKDTQINLRKEEALNRLLHI